MSAANLTTACEVLGTYVAQMHYGQLPPVVVERAKLLILDSLGCTLGGSRSAWGDIVLRAARAWIGAEQDGAECLSQHRRGLTGIVGTNWCTGVIDAAQVNALLANCLDYDDTLYGHPGAVLVPSALALGDVLERSGAEVIAALVAGYEIAGRVSAASEPTPQCRQRVWGTGCRFAPGVAAVASSLLRLDPIPAAHALAIAGASGPLPSVCKSVYSLLGPSMVKNNYHMAVAAGVTAAYLAQQGFTGPLDLFEGPGAFGDMVGSDRWDATQLTTGLGCTYQVMAVSLKPYPCCRFSHAALEAALAIQREHALKPDQITAIRVRTFSWAASGCFADPAPASMPAAQFSTVYCLAVALCGYSPGPSWFTAMTGADTRVRRLTSCIELVPWPEYDARYQEGEWVAHVEIHAGGWTFTRLVRFPLGHPSNPMTTDAVLRKFDMQAIAALGEAQSRQVREAILRLESLERVCELMPLLRSHVGRATIN